MKKTRLVVAVSIAGLCVLGMTVLFAQTEFKHGFMATEPFTKARMQFLPVPGDFRNYFVVQSIDDNTNILIGDFVGSDKMFSLVMDDGSDGKIDRVIEYFPDSKKFLQPARPTTKFFTNLNDFKREVIEGSIFKNNYTYKMSSLDLLKSRIEKGRDIFRADYNYNVKIYDPDRPSTVMSEFFFGKKLGRYDLIFATYYYKIFYTQISPVVSYSVYCRNSKDPVVAEIVESLIKMVPKS